MMHPTENATGFEAAITISAGKARLSGVLSVPPDVGGVVIFAHGSGSSRFSPRNRIVAAAIQRRGFATLLFDLLMDSEAADRRNVFHIPLLAERLLAATAWVGTHPATESLPIGYFGASTGAAGALVAAASAPVGIAAVVSRGGRPDLASQYLARVSAPTLLIVGGDDFDVLVLNERACAKLTCEKQLRIVPGATHLFEEPGAMDQVIRLACGWFETHLAGAAKEDSI